MANPLSTTFTFLTSGFGKAGSFMWILYILIPIVIIGALIFLFAYWRRSQNSWNLTFRVRQEDKQKGQIFLDPVVIRAKRIVLSNGLRLILLEKEILGKKLFPSLNHYTTPGVYDLIVTADNRIFLISGIKGIDEDRKELKVGIRYPGIDYSLDEVNRDHMKLNQADRRSDLLGIVKAISIAIIAIVILIIFIIGVNKYIEAKKIDAAIAQNELQLFEAIGEYQTKQNENTNAMILLIDQLKDLIGEEDLRNRLEQVKAG